MPELFSDAGAGKGEVEHDDLGLQASRASGLVGELGPLPQQSHELEVF